MSSVRRTTSFLWRHWTALRAAAAGVLLLVAVVSCAGQTPQPRLSPVAVAARDIASGATLTADDLATGEDSLGVTTPNPEDLVGESVRGPISAGEPITASRLTPGRSVPTQPGSVVFPLTLADQRIAGLLVAGDRVDVIVTPDALHQGRARTVAADVEVLTVAAAADSGPASLSQAGSVVLLAVEQEQARQLAQIRRSDHVSVAIG
jgi:Flp pilus assembly protein CpaB